MKVKDIATPALLFDQKFNRMEFVKDRNFLSVTTRSGLKRGLMIGSIVIDSLGNTFKTLSAKRKSNYYPFWKFEFFDPFIYIEIELEKVNNIEFDDLKSKIEKIIKRDRDEWANYGNVTDIRGTINRTQSYDELVSTIGSFVQPL